MLRAFSAFADTFNMLATRGTARIAGLRPTMLVPVAVTPVRALHVLGARAAPSTGLTNFQNVYATPALRMIVRAAATEEAGATAEESRSIFITNISWSTDNDSLNRAISAEVGGVVRANVLMRDGRSMGRAIVDFDSPSAAQSAVQKLDQIEIDGRTIGVRIAEPRAPRVDRGERRERFDRGGDRGYDRGERRERRPPREGAERGERQQRDPETLLYVGNLSWGTTWQDLRDLFSESGHPCEFADVKRDADGRSRGFAIAAFGSPDAAAAAADALNQTELGGRTLNVRRFNTQ